MLNFKIFISATLIAVGTLGCKSVSVDTDTYPTQVTIDNVTTPSATRQAEALPSARVYKTNGDWNDQVPVTLNFMRTVIVSYPAPTDITPSQEPIALEGGYLLDRRGIGPYSAFTTYTYSQYAALKEVPSTEQLWKSIIPEARVTEIIELPFPLNQAQSDIGECNRLVSEGFPGCKLVFRVPDTF